MTGKPDAQFVLCLHCRRGPKAEQSCSAGYGVRTLKLGCFLGEWLPGKCPKKINGVKVEAVAAASYREARAIAETKGFKEWVYWPMTAVVERHR